MKVTHLTKEEFLVKVANYIENPDEWKFLGDKPAVIDFYASWCGPCKMLAPILEEVAEEYDGKIDVYKVNVEDEEELAGLFGVRSVPTVLYIPMEGNPQVTQGAMPKASLKEVINNVLMK